jgi:hypothetical protein
MPQYHIQESLVHLKRLQQLVSGMGRAHFEQVGIARCRPICQPLLEMMSNTMTRQERELKGLRGLDFGKREGTFYLMLIQKAQMAGGQFLTTGEPLALNTKGEQNMTRW